MFLRAIGRFRRDDAGAALAAVLGLMGVGLILTSLIMTSVVAGTGFTTATRAGVQAQAAAEAGVAAARAGLAAGTCSEASGAPVYTSATGATPRYVATIWRPAGGGTWEARCPLGAATPARIVSTGYATATGVGQAGGDSVKLEAILGGTVVPTAIVASGPAIFAHAAGSFGNSGKLLSVDGSTPSVLIKTGNVNCTGAGQGVADFVVEGGTLLVGAGCNIAGNAWSSGRMTVSGSGYIGGNAIANGISLDGSGRINLRAWSYSDISLSGNPTVSGVVKAYSAVLNGGTFGAEAWIYGNVNVQNAGGTNLNGTVTTQTTVPTPPNWWGGNSKITRVNPITSPTFNSDVPTPPTVPDWVDFGAQPEHYTSAGWVGFTVYTMGTACAAANVLTAVASIGNNPGLIDARSCSGVFTVDGATTVTLTNDLVVIGKKIRITGSGKFTSTAKRSLWLINPDTNANQLPDCAGQSLVIDGGSSFPNMNTMIYSPCKVTVTSSTALTGQIFAGEVTLGGAGQLSYVPVGLPGVNLTSGVTSPPSGGSSSRPLVSLRNVTG